MQYLREADGKASVSTDDWILVFGEENGWLMIVYRVSESQLRFGYIQATQEQAGVNVPALVWTDERVMLSDVTNDPFFNASSVISGSGWADLRDATLLGILGRDWGYVETATDDGIPVRGFAVNGFFYTLPENVLGCIGLAYGKSAVLYDVPGGREIGRLYPGATVAVKEERGGMVRVVYYQSDDESGDDNARLDLSVQGWIDADAVVRGMDGREYLEETDFEPAHMVWMMAEGETLEDVAQHGAEAYILLAEMGETAYLEYPMNGVLWRTKLSRLRGTTRGMLYLPESSGDDEEEGVTLYWGDFGARSVSDGAERAEECEPGLALDVMMHTDGAVLAFVHERALCYMVCWVDERNVMEIR